MSTLQTLDDHIIARYTAQPTRLPAELRRESNTLAGRARSTVALADLDQSCASLSVVGPRPRHIAVAKREKRGWHVRSVERRASRRSGKHRLSANTLTILGTRRTALALLRYTHRATRAFEKSGSCSRSSPGS